MSRAALASAAQPSASASSATSASVRSRCSATGVAAPASPSIRAARVPSRCARQRFSAAMAREPPVRPRCSSGRRDARRTRQRQSAATASVWSRIRATVGDAQLQSRVFEGGPHDPPQEARIRDRAGARHGAHEAVVVLGAVEEVGQAGARHLAEHAQPVAGEPGRAALPEGRGGGKREQQRREGHEAVHEVDPRLGPRHLDMDVHPADHAAPAHQAQLARQGLVAVLRRMALARPARDGVGAGGEDEQAVLPGDPGQAGAQTAEHFRALPEIGGRRRGRLHLRLQELALRPGQVRAGRGVEGLQRASARRAARGGIRQEVLLLDAETEGRTVHAALLSVAERDRRGNAGRTPPRRGRSGEVDHRPDGCVIAASPAQRRE